MKINSHEPKIIPKMYPIIPTTTDKVISASIIPWSRLSIPTVKFNKRVTFEVKKYIVHVHFTSAISSLKASPMSGKNKKLQTIN